MTPYISPVRIVPEKDRQRLEPANLDRLRKELLLRFELDNRTTIHIEGNEYDRATLLDALEQLRLQPDFHLKLFHFKDLLDFIETGALTLFTHSRNWSFMEDATFFGWVQPLFTDRLSAEIYQAVAGQHFQDIDRLKTIYHSEIPLPDAVKERGYSRAYSLLEQSVRICETRFQNPFFKKGKIRVDPEIKKYLNGGSLAVFRLLPASFDRLKERFGVYAHNLLYDAFKVTLFFDNFDLETLEVIRIAAKIDWEFRKDQWSKDLLQKLDQYQKKKKPATGGLPAWALILGLILGLRLIMAAATCDLDNRSHYAYQPVFPVKEYYPLIYEWDLQNTWLGLTTFPDSSEGFEVIRFIDLTQGESLLFLPEAGGTRFCESRYAFTWKWDFGNETYPIRQELHRFFTREETDCLAGTIPGAKTELLTRQLDSIRMDYLEKSDTKKKEFSGFYLTRKSSPEFYNPVKYEMADTALWDRLFLPDRKGKARQNEIMAALGESWLNHKRVDRGENIYDLRFEIKPGSSRVKLRMENQVYDAGWVEFRDGHFQFKPRAWGNGEKLLDLDDFYYLDQEGNPRRGRLTFYFDLSRIRITVVSPDL